MAPKESAKKAVSGHKKATATKATATKKAAPAKKPTAKKVPRGAMAPARTAASKSSKGPARRPAPTSTRSRKAPQKPAKASKTTAKTPKKPSKKAPEKKAPGKRGPTAKAAKATTTKAATTKGATTTKTAKATTTKPAPVTKEPAKKEPAKKSLLERAVPRRKPGSVICPLSGFEVMPTAPNLSEKTVERLRRKLVDERERHLRQAEELQAEAEALALERDPGDTQFDEESGEGDTVNIERERDLLLSASARQMVEAIDRALARMSAGSYGLCVPAGRRIALERLEAIPYAEECVDCKARAERRR
jgi:RNA polymerase-binding transcription factor DksA